MGKVGNCSPPYSHELVFFVRPYSHCWWINTSIIPVSFHRSNRPVDGERYPHL